MDKYNIDKQLIKGSEFVAPINLWVIFFASLFMRTRSRGFDKKRVVVNDYKVDRTRFHIVCPIELLDKDAPCIFYIHGGGFIFRSSKEMYQSEEEMALNNRCRVIGIDYDLAPKHKFPHQINQCFDVYKYIIDNFKELKINRNKIIMMGDSAGGSLALDTFLKLRDENLLKPCGLLLIYPVVDNAMNTDSMKKYDDTPVWNNKCNRKMWKYYLSDKEYISPLRKDLSNFPKTYIELTEFDCLHDEGMKLYLKLKDCGIDITLNDTKGTYHGYDSHKEAQITIDSIKKRMSFINEALKN